MERARFAKSLGADAVMMMPPYHGALLKGTPEQCFEQVPEVGEVGIPIMIQDAALSSPTTRTGNAGSGLPRRPWSKAA